MLAVVIGCDRATDMGAFVVSPQEDLLDHELEEAQAQLAKLQARAGKGKQKRRAGGGRAAKAEAERRWRKGERDDGGGFLPSI